MRIIRGLFLLLLSCLTFPIVAQDLNNGLIAYYPLGGSNGNDKSGSGYNGTLFGVSRTTDILGFTDSASLFNGSTNYISIGNISSLGFSSGDYSICAKFRTTSTGYDVLTEKVSFSGPNGTADYGWGLDNQAGILRAVVYTGLSKSPSPPNRYELLSTIFINDGKWHSVVITYNAAQDTLKMYIDCMFNNKVYCPTSPAANNQNLCIGRREVDNSCYWKGGADEVRFYNRVLTGREAEIYGQNIYETNPLGKDTTLCNFPLSLNARNKGLRYQWSTGDTLQIVSVNDTGIYWVDIYGFCSSYRDSFHIKGISSPSLFIGNDTLICPGDSINLKSNIVGTSYSWSTGSSQNNIWISSPGTYTISVSTSCGLKNDTINISGFAYSLGPDTVICNSDSIRLIGPPGAISYQWSTGDTLNEISVKDSGVYIVMANFPCGIVKDTISIFETPKLFIGLDTVICGAFSKQLRTNEPFSSYLWSTGDTTSLINISASGNYWLRVTDRCGFQYDTISVSDMVFELGANRILCTSVDSTILISPMAADSVVWSDGTKNMTLISRTKGVYWVQVYSKCGVLTDTVVLYDRSDFELPPDSVVCDLSNINFTLSVPFVEGFQYHWAGSLNDTFPSKSISDTGLYVLTISTNCGVLIDSFRITMQKEPLSSDTLYSCSFPFTIKAQKGFDNYYWNGIIGSDSNDVIAPGRYYLKADINNCSILDSIIISPLIQDSIDIIGDTIVCLGTKVNLKNNYSNAVRWGTDTQSYNSIIIAPTSSGWYYARTNDTLNCISKVDSIFISVVQPPVADFVFFPEEGGNIPIDILFENKSNNSTKWLWFINSTTDSGTTRDWSYKFDDTISTSVTLVAINDYGCRDSITKEIPLREEFYLRIPNAFTPNSDGLNDSFQMEYSGIDSLSYSIYNRWGQHIFEASTPNLRWWDGSFKGQKVPDGAYFLIVTYQRKGEPKKLINGTITILR